jgi:ribonucleoside-diphosphate reductase alpha chain
MASVVGPFAKYEENEAPMQRVMHMHRDASREISDAGPEYLKQAAVDLWDKVIELGERYGYRNAQATVLAPTGTISFMMECDTTGIEPDIALVKYKQLAGGGMLKIVNQSVRAGLTTLGYDDEAIKAVVEYIDKNDTIEGAPFLKDEHLPVFDCAFKPAKGTRSIPWQAHVQMMAAAQPFLSGAISKTVNMPSDVTPKDIADAYFWGWELGLKAIAIYRDGSKQSQPLSTKSESDKASEAAQEKIVYKPRRERLPDTRQSITHKFNISGHEGYLNVGLYPDGRPGELFITMAKEGSTVGGLMDSFGTAISMSLQYGVPLEVLVNKFSHTRFEPMGHTTNPDVRIAKSVVDYIFRWMGVTFLAGYREAANGHLPEASSPSVKADSGKQNAVAKLPKTNGNGAAADSFETRTSAQAGSGRVVDPISLQQAGITSTGPDGAGRQDQFRGFQSDAPACDNCGSITVRNGNCYLCHNCGNSMGCS